jgi:hypothetical protein
LETTDNNRVYDVSQYKNGALRTFVPIPFPSSHFQTCHCTVPKLGSTPQEPTLATDETTVAGLFA